MKRQPVSIIRNPVRYITPTLREGDTIIVHKITPKTKIFNLTFSVDEIENCLLPNISCEIAVQEYISSIRSLTEDLEILENEIIFKSGIFLKYNYLFLVNEKKKQFELLSLSLEDIPLSGEVIHLTALDLGVHICRPVWKGVYNLHNISAFVEDIYIQKA